MHEFPLPNFPCFAQLTNLSIAPRSCTHPHPHTIYLWYTQTHTPLYCLVSAFLLAIYRTRQSLSPSRFGTWPLVPASNPSSSSSVHGSWLTLHSSRPTSETYKSPALCRIRLDCVQVLPLETIVGLGITGFSVAFLCFPDVRGGPRPARSLRGGLIRQNGPCCCVWHVP